MAPAWDHSIPPIASIPSGETVSFDLLDASCGQIAAESTVDAIRKIVFSRTLESVEWNNSTLLKEVVPEDIEQLKQEPGRDMLIYGSASLRQGPARCDQGSGRCLVG